MHESIRNSIVLTLSLILATQAIFLPVVLSILFSIVIFIFYLNAKKNKRTSKVITFLFVLSALLSIFLSFKTFLGVEAGVAVLSTFLFAKSLETKAKRDIIVLFNFALFVSASCFLYSQAVWMAILVLMCFLSSLIGLYRLQSIDFLPKHEQKSYLVQDVKHVGKLVLFAIPFFVLLFLFFPRLPPLWHIPIPDDSGVTGLSDTMSPGDIAKLSQSSELAFRVMGDMKQLPERSELYWRALVLDQYDGQTWTSNFINQQPIQNEKFQQLKGQLDYQYLPADARVKWVTALEKSVPQQSRYALRADWSVISTRPNARVTPISMKWIGDGTVEGIDQNIPDWVKSINLKVPVTDVKAQQFAKNLYEKSGKNSARYIENILNWYKSNGFVYTLSPGLLGQHRVDEFLFQSKQGFCEHYASSFVMLMRYVGIPARVVVGYQGGQLSPDGETWEVRQLDAHAWSEAYIDGKWQRFDPTAIIAPERIDSGMQNMLASNQRVLGDHQSNWKYQQFNLVNNLRVWSDYLGYQWQSKVVGYDVESQKNWFNRIGLQSSYSAVLLLISGIIFVVGSYFSLLKFTQYKNRDKVLWALGKMSKILPDELQKEPSEPISMWLKRISVSLPSGQVDAFKQCASVYEQYKYQNRSEMFDVSQLLLLIDKCTNIVKEQRYYLFSQSKINNIDKS